MFKCKNKYTNFILDLCSKTEASTFLPYIKVVHNTTGRYNSAKRCTLYHVILVKMYSFSTTKVFVKLLWIVQYSLRFKFFEICIFLSKVQSYILFVTIITRNTTVFLYGANVNRSVTKPQIKITKNTSRERLIFH